MKRYGWWKTLEHYAAPDSSPEAVSSQLDTVERDARAKQIGNRKSPVIGESDGGEWTVAYLVERIRRAPSAEQGRKYLNARRGGSRGNLGPVPPEAELFIETIDLDAGVNGIGAGQSTTDPASLLAELPRLRRASGDGGATAPYKDVVILWAVNRARRGQARLVPFNDVRDELAELLGPVRIAVSEPKPEDPWFALRSSQWWELEGVPTGASAAIVRQHNLRGGLSELAFDLIVADPDFAAEATAVLEGLIRTSGVWRRATPMIERIPAPKKAHLDWVPAEQHLTERYSVAGTEAGERERREGSLQRQYLEFLESLGHTVISCRITVEAGKPPLVIDLYDETDKNLIEAKLDVKRETLRLALGQILDYARYVEECQMRTLLVPEQPDADMLELFAQFGIEVVWHTDSPSSAVGPSAQ